MVDGYSDKERNPLRAAQEELNTAQENLLKAYLQTIDNKFPTLHLLQKSLLLHNLEATVKKLEGELKRSYDIIRLIDFDRAEATRIRIKEGLTQQQLAKLVGISQAQLARYEMGKYKKGINLAYKSERYILWLMEHGYIPSFKL